jgi:hypothetical protein
MEILLSPQLHGPNERVSDRPLSTVPPGQPLGWSAIVEPHTFTASARAAGASRVVAFDGLAVARLADENCHFCSLLMKKVAQTISGRLKDTRIQLLSLVVVPATKVVVPYREDYA